MTENWIAITRRNCETNSTGDTENTLRMRTQGADVENGTN